MIAQKQMMEHGISVGIILLEILKPYEVLANLVSQALPKNDCKLLFLEEEIQSGGMGMNLSSQMMRRHGLASDSFEILAVDDSFVARREIGQSVYEAAGVDAKQIEKAILRLS